MLMVPCNSCNKQHQVTYYPVADEAMLPATAVWTVVMERRVCTDKKPVKMSNKPAVNPAHCSPCYRKRGFGLGAWLFEFFIERFGHGRAIVEDFLLGIMNEGTIIIILNIIADMCLHG